MKGWANVGCRCATAIVQTAQRSWARIGEPCGGRITLGWERCCLDRRKGLRTFHAARNGGVLSPRFCPRETSVRVVLTRTMVSSVSSRRTAFPLSLCPRPACFGLLGKGDDAAFDALTFPRRTRKSVVHFRDGLGSPSYISATDWEVRRTFRRRTGKSVVRFRDGLGSPSYISATD